MSDPISPTGSPGQVPALAILSLQASAVTEVQVKAVAAEAVGPSAALRTIKAEGGTLPAAAKLELSTPPPVLDQAPKPMDMEDAAKAFQDYLTNLPSDLQFIPDASSGIVIFKVINPITQKVLRQYPPEEMLETARHLRNILKKEHTGILLDQNL